MCYATRDPGSGAWMRSDTGKLGQGDRFVLRVVSDTVYLMRGVRSRLLNGEGKGDEWYSQDGKYDQESLYLERYQDGDWGSLLTNTYSVASTTTAPQVTKHYYANPLARAGGQRIATRVDDSIDDKLYYPWYWLSVGVTAGAGWDIRAPLIHSVQNDMREVVLLRVFRGGTDMARRKQSTGKCAFCGREMTKGGLSRHLKTCPQRVEAINTAQQGPGQAGTLFHLQAQDAWSGDFWLHLEMRGSATLNDLDRYLRAIWLECCGHLSQFSIGGWAGHKISMTRRVEQVFEPELVLTHIYDFGTSSETLIKVVDVRQGKPLTSHPIFLMARNNRPQVPCVECDQLASWLCFECLYELDEPGTLCDRHAKSHPHEEYGELVPLVNSPRVGMCGYTGPAEPPY